MWPPPFIKNGGPIFKTGYGVPIFWKKMESYELVKFVNLIIQLNSVCKTSDRMVRGCTTVRHMILSILFPRKYVEKFEFIWLYIFLKKVSDQALKNAQSYELGFFTKFKFVNRKTNVSGSAHSINFGCPKHIMDSPFFIFNILFLSAQVLRHRN